MPEQIDLQECWRVMNAAVVAAQDPAVRADEDFVEWARHVRAFSELCAKVKLKSYVAVLGTALLAKAANPRVDVCSLKAGDMSGGAYDARRPAEKVLVPASQTHGFSLGTTGPQPLNNQPFFRAYRIDRGMTVRGHAKPVLGELLRLLHEIQQFRSEEAVLALAAFINVRRDYVPKYRVREGALAIGTTEQLAAAIATLVSERSEGGGRAQACAGGLLDALYSVERVRVGKKNEPDRHMPGDVGIRPVDATTDRFVRVFEVRDKSVPPHAAQAFAAKVAAADVGRAVLVAIAADQESLNVSELKARARELGVDLEVFLSWPELVRFVMFAANQRELTFVEAAVVTIRARLVDLELSTESVELWDGLTSRSYK